MKRILSYFNIAVLALASVIAIGCSKDSEDSVQTPVTDIPKTVTLTTTISLGGESNARTRALTDGGVKTFAVGDQIAVIYTHTSDKQVKAVSNALAAGNITVDGKSATFTVTLTSPKAGSVDYIYPASMAKDDGTINYSTLCMQDGTLASLASKLDCAKGTGIMTESGGVFTLPAIDYLDNQFAICKFNIKNSGGTDITSSITGLTLTDGTNTYTVSREATAGPIYVAMQPVSSDKTLSFVANSTSNSYYKSVKGKALAAGDMVPVNLTMGQQGNITDLSQLNADCTAQHGDILTGQLAASHQISIAAGATVILKNVDINYGRTLTASSYAGITCLGNATLIISGTDYVKGFSSGYPGIFVPSGSTLTITGAGTLYALGQENGAGIGSGRSDIDAVKNAGNIILQGGTIWGTGGTGAAGIGSGAGADEKPSSCGDITIRSSVTQVTGTAGSGAANIGSGNHSTCGTVTIE
jgi:hypothetical protein